MSCRRTALLLLAILVIVPTTAAQGPNLIAGPNVNMVSGTTWPDGDPFLQRQNEPSIAASTRGSLTLMAASNDYRTVDLPGLTEGLPIADSWIGVYTSFDGGGSWTSTLLPGYPQDQTVPGLSSPIYGLQAAADPVMRAGTHGMFYLSGIVFDRGETPRSKLFVARYVDLNNDPDNPVQYIDTVEVASYTYPSTVFIDKPWLAVDIPEPNALTKIFQVDQEGNPASPVTQTVQCGNLYLAWAEIESVGGDVVESRIMTSTSANCGDSWSPPVPISDPGTINQGASVAIGPNSGNVYVSWRQLSGAGAITGEISGGGEIGDCGRGLGFWKNQPEDWPLETVFLGGVEHTKAEAIAILNTNAGGDITYTVFGQLLAAKLSFPFFHPTVSPVIADADQWLADNPLGTNPTGDTKDEGSALAKELRSYTSVKKGPIVCGFLTPESTGEPDLVADDAIMVTASTNGGGSFDTATLVRSLEPWEAFDQGTSEYSFRTTAYPTMTVDTVDRVYVAWSERGETWPGPEGEGNPDPVEGDSRIMVATLSYSGSSFTEHSLKPIDQPKLPGHQIQPAMTYINDHLFMVYNDFRKDYSGVFDRFVMDLLTIDQPYRHTVDVRAAVAVPGPDPEFTDYSIIQNSNPAELVRPSGQVSRYLFMPTMQGVPAVLIFEQLEYNPPVLPMFKGGTVPFFGDYVDVAGMPPFIPDGYGGWTWNTSSLVTPTAHAVWTDNRNVVGPPDGDWTSFVPLGMGGPSIFDPNVIIPACDPDSDDVDRTRMRNQDIYTSRLTAGLHVAVPGNSRPLNDSFQRGFVVFVQNGTRDTRYFRLEILGQPIGGHASFDQFDSVPYLDVEIGAYSSASQTVYAMSTEATASIRVSVTEWDGPGGGPLLGGQQSTVLINPDPSNPGPSNPSVLEGEVHTPAVFNPAVYNPAVYNPAVFNPAVFNPAVFNPAVFNPAVFNDAVLNYNVENPAVFNPAVFNPAVYNPAVFNPAVLNMALMNPAVFNPAVLNPAVFNPAVLNPAVFNPAVFNPAVFNPAVLNPAVLNPAVFNPAVLNPAVLNPAVLNPAVLNPAVFNTTFADGSATDVNLVAENHGNTTSSYTLNLALNNDPPGFKYQLLIYRLYFTPVVDECTLSEASQQELLVNDLDPDIHGDLLDRGDVSFYLDPGDYAVITLRILPDPDASVPGDPSEFPLEEVSAAVVADAVDTPDELIGDTRSSYDTFGALEIHTNALPGGNVGNAYSVLLTASGGSGSYAWNLLPGLGTLPDGLSLSAAGLITGTPTATGTFDFTVQVDDGYNIAEETLSISIVSPSGGPVFLTQPSSATAGEFAPRFSVLVLDDNGIPIPGITVDLSLAAIGCAGASLSGGISAVADIEGVATFIGVTVDRGGYGYILGATATIPGYLPATAVSVPFGVAGFCGTDDLGAARQDHTATLLPDSRVLIAGGANNSGTEFATAELYDPSTGLYGTTGGMGIARTRHTATLLPTGLVLVTGGYAAGSVTAYAELYNPGTGTFTPTGSMAHARQQHTATLLDSGRVLIVGGLDDLNNEVSVAELYDPATGNFTATTGGLVQARMNHTATLLADGRVFVAGGTVLGGVTVFDTAEVYDPATDTFNTSYLMNSVRSSHAAVLLTDGTVLIAGGFDPSATASAEIFDPVAGTIIPTDSMDTARTRFTATLLNTGQVVVTGGSDGSTALDSAEIYDAVAGTFAPAGDMIVRRQSFTTTLLASGEALVTGGLGFGGTEAEGEIYFPLLGSTFKVVTANNDGVGSLRQAILSANIGPSRDAIEFDIPGPGPHTISLSSPLPIVLHPVVIDGTTEPDYAGTPVVELDGSGAGEATGLEMWAGSSDVIALAINRFEADGIAVFSKGQNQILGNYIGTDVTGTALLQNQGHGIYLNGSCNNTIGGSAPAHQNIIAGNIAYGLLLEADSDGNTIQGNWIGTNPSMDTGLGNGQVVSSPYGRGIGVRSSDGTLIGGADPGTGNTVAYNPSGIIVYQGSRARIEGNLISGSTIGTGIVIQEGHDVEVFSNLIGTDATGKVAIGNNRGMIITRDSTNVVVGGPFGRNIISGNRTDGIYIVTPYTPFTPVPSESCVIENNFIGTDIDGIFAIPNEGTSPTKAGIVTSGSYAVIRGNLISGNAGKGVYIWSGSNNIVEDNRIGTTADGNTELPNGESGVHIESTSTANSVVDNLISGNTEYGVHLRNAQSTTVAGNTIGLNEARSARVPNEGGVKIFDGSSGNTIGGLTPAESNVISGNTEHGVHILGDSELNFIRGNFIGTNLLMSGGLGNSSSGIHVDGSENNAIGGIAAGAGNTIVSNGLGVYLGSAHRTNVVGNVVSGNGSEGIFLDMTDLCIIDFNKIGTLADGDTGLGNTGYGIEVYRGDGNAIRDNVISDNSDSGILLGKTVNASVLRNYIGVDGTATDALGNFHGIEIDGLANNNAIGAVGSGNVISGNRNSGIYAPALSGISYISIRGNWIGTNPSFDSGMGNDYGGIRFWDDRDSVIERNWVMHNGVPGGWSGIQLWDSTDARVIDNVLSGNTGSGITLAGTTSGALVIDNLVGTTPNGLAALGNGFDGIDLYGAGVTNNTVTGNVIADNRWGIVIWNFPTPPGPYMNTVIGNTIGLDITGTTPLPNQIGIFLRDGAHNNTIGRPGSDANVIASNSGAGIAVGVDLADTGTYGNAISWNSIFNNGGLGIDLANNGVTANDGGDTDGGPHELVNYPIITLANDTGAATNVTGTVNAGPLGGTWRVRFYSNPSGSCDPSGFGEGRTFVGEALASNIGGGTVGFAGTLPGGLSGSVLTATVTSDLAPWNTSEFSQCFSVP